MIQFTITIKQHKSGGINFQCETPPGSATLLEMDAAHAFMENFKEFTCKGGHTVIVSDWKHDQKNKTRNN